MGLRAPRQFLDARDRYTPDPDVTQALTASLAELRWWAEVLADARRNRLLPA